MDWEKLYISPEWAALREAALRRDGDRCTVARLLGGDCSFDLHVHHLNRDEALALDLDNVATTCSRHHPTWESVRRSIVEAREPKIPPCRHRHYYDSARRECRERRERLARRKLAA